MAKISVYLNGLASNSNDEMWRHELQKHLFRHELNIHSPDSLIGLTSLLDEDIKNQVEYIFSIGGDGTANLIIQKIAGLNIKLMVIPAGTANDFAHQMGLEAKIHKIMQIFQHKTTSKVDLIKINGTYIFSAGGIGLACDVAYKTNQLRRQFSHFKKFMKSVGATIYPTVLGSQFLLHPLKLHKLFLESPDLPLLDPRIETALIIVSNQPVLGGYFPIAPDTKNDDGFFNVSIFLHKSKKELLKCAWRVMRKDYPADDPNFVNFETKRLVMTSLDQKPLDFFGDGEVIKRDKIIEVTIVTKALEVCSYNEQLMYSNSYSLEQIDKI